MNRRTDVKADGRSVTIESSRYEASLRRTRRKERDDFAERRAIQVLVALFLGFGGLSFAALNFFWVSSDNSPVPKVEDVSHDVKSHRNDEETQHQLSGRLSSGAMPEFQDLPAIRKMTRIGLTIAAEGIPKVDVDGGGAKVEDAAGLEACRFAYGVWEFSPNQTFRFLSTCRGLGRMTLVGAYEVNEGKIYLSKLTDGNAQWTSLFEVAQPTTMRTQVFSRKPKKTKLRVTQRVTTLRGGLHGDDFRDSFMRKNRLTAPKTVSRPEPSLRSGPQQQEKRTPQDTLESLLLGSGE